MNLFSWTRKESYENSVGTQKTRRVINAPGIISSVFAIIIGCTVVFGSMYTIDEGHVGIVKRFSQAQSQVDPGLHFKLPLVDSIVEMEIRTRKNVEDLAGATSEQMPIKARVSVNWTVDKTQALSLYKKYGGLEQFEARILDPRFRSVTKQALSKFRAEELIKERQLATFKAESGLVELMAPFSVVLDSLQIENIGLPPTYLKSIETKQTAKNLADAEEFKLQQQDLVAQQDVNIKKATAAGIEVVSIQKAAAIEREGKAEAAAIEAKGKALLDNPLIVQLTHEQQWNGSLLTTQFGGNTGVLVNAPPNLLNK